VATNWSVATFWSIYPIFTAMYQLKRLPWQSLTTRDSTVDAALWTEKLNILNSVSIGTLCGVKSYNNCSKCCLSPLT